MTHNQIAYANMRETQRANIARESETQRSNVQSERIGLGNLHQRAFEYSDMAGFNKALSVATTFEKAAKGAEHTAKAVKTVVDTANPFNKWK